MMASMIAGVVAYAVSRGIAFERILAETELDPADLVDPNRRIPEQRMPRLWRLLACEFPDEVISIEMAKVAPLEQIFGALSNAIRFAADVRSAIHMFTRYQTVLGEQLRLTVVEHPSAVHVEMQHPMDLLDDGYAAEMSLAVATRIVRENLAVNQESLLRVEFANPPHGPISVYEDFFRAPCRFEQETNALVLDHATMHAPTRNSNPELLAYIYRHLDSVREGLRGATENRELDHIRAAIVEDAKRQEYSTKSLARRLGMSERSLHRYTKARETTVQALLDEVRLANAKQLLADPKFSTEEVAQLLGYSSDRAFRRAFERWTGRTPAQYRRTEHT